MTSPAAEPPGDWTGETLSAGRYHVRSRIGRGGMSVVYLARDRTLDQYVAVKAPNPEFLAAPWFRPRFEREIRSLIRLSHPHVVRVLDLGEHRGVPYLVLQHLPGGNLASWRARLRAKPPEQRLDWLPPVARALDAIHEQGYVHRDVKPQNILLDQRGNPYLGDFGLVKVLGAAFDNLTRDGEFDPDSAAEPEPEPESDLASTPSRRPDSGDDEHVTRAGAAIGTLPYMPLELLLGVGYDGRVDQYALAVVAYELLAGRRPHLGRDKRELLKQLARDTPPPPPGIPPAAAEVLLRALAREPADRFPDCSAFADALLGALRAEPRPDAPASVPDPAAPPRNPEAPPAPDRALPCPACGARVRVPALLADRHVRCARCRTPLRVDPDARALRLRDPAPAPAPTPAPAPATVQTEPPPSLVELDTSPSPLADPSRDTRSSTRRTPLPLPPRLLVPLVVLALLSAILLALLLPAPRNSNSNPLAETRPGNNTEPDPAAPRQPTAPPPDPLAGLPETLVNSLGIEFRLVRPGTFVMGAPPEDPFARSNELPARTVALTRPYYLATAETTVAALRAYLDDVKLRTSAERLGGFTRRALALEPENPVPDRERHWDAPGFPQSDDHPAAYVDWITAVEFCEWLSRRERRNYRLPTEAEWERAAWAGRPHVPEWTLADAPSESPLPGTRPALEPEPNPWGFRGMLENVSEWCLDAYIPAYLAAVPDVDPLVPPEREQGFRVLRGGSFARPGPVESRPSHRDGRYAPVVGMEDSGFRILLEIDPRLRASLAKNPAASPPPSPSDP